MKRAPDMEGWGRRAKRVRGSSSAAPRAAEPARPTTEDADLLDGLPYLALNLVNAPEQLLRQLFEVLQLMVRLHYDSEEVTIRITLPADLLSDVATTADRDAGGGPDVGRGWDGGRARYLRLMLGVLVGLVLPASEAQRREGGAHEGEDAGD